MERKNLLLKSLSIKKSSDVWSLASNIPKGVTVMLIPRDQWKILVLCVRCKGSVQFVHKKVAPPRHLFLTGDQLHKPSYKYLPRWKTSLSSLMFTVSPSDGGNIWIIWSWFMWHMVLFSGKYISSVRRLCKVDLLKFIWITCFIPWFKNQADLTVSHCWQVFNIFGLESSFKPNGITLQKKKWLFKATLYYHPYSWCSDCNPSSLVYLQQWTNSC